MLAAGSGEPEKFVDFGLSRAALSAQRQFCDADPARCRQPEQAGFVAPDCGAFNPEQGAASGNNQFRCGAADCVALQRNELKTWRLPMIQAVPRNPGALPPATNPKCGTRVCSLNDANDACTMQPKDSMRGWIAHCSCAQNHGVFELYNWFRARMLRVPGGLIGSLQSDCGLHTAAPRRMRK